MWETWIASISGKKVEARMGPKIKHFTSGGTRGKIQKDQILW